MQYPTINIIPGSDIKTVVKILKAANVKYKWKTKIFQKQTELIVGSNIWLNKSRLPIYIKDIQEGLKLSFFKPEAVKLLWDITYILKDWSFDNWDIDLTNDIKLWISDKFNIVLNNNEKLIMSNIVDERINWETETLKIYTETLIPTFKHPDIQNLLNVCVSRKKNHVYLWNYIKIYFKLSTPDVKRCITNRFVVISLYQLINDLTMLIATEQILKPSSLKCLTHFTIKGHLGQFIKFVNRINQESQQHGKMLTMLLEQIKKMYPFLDEFIEICTTDSKFYTRQKDASFYKLSIIEIFNNQEYVLKL